MIALRRFFLIPALLLSSQLAEGKEPDRLKNAEAVLKSANLDVTTDGIVRYFESRIPSAEMQKKAAEQVELLSSRLFSRREKATRALEKMGEQARGALETASKSTDPEVKRRAQSCLKQLAAGLDPRVEQAAILYLCLKAPKGATSILLRYCPFAQGVNGREEISSGLFELHQTTGSPGPELVKALKNPSPMVRKIAAGIVGCYGTKAQQATVRFMATNDSSYAVRAQSTRGLLLSGDASMISLLPKLMTDAPFEVAIESESLLLDLAGKKAHPAYMTKKSADRKRARGAWEKWIAAHAKEIKLDRKKSRELFISSRARVMRTIAQFLEAAPNNGGVEKLKEIVGFPFEIAGFQVFHKWEELEKLFRSAGKAPQIKWEAPELIPVAEYWKSNGLDEKAPRMIPPNKGKAEFDKVPVSSMRAARVRYTQGTKKEIRQNYILLRFYGSRVKVVGIR